MKALQHRKWINKRMEEESVSLGEICGGENSNSEWLNDRANILATEPVSQMKRARKGTLWFLGKSVQCSSLPAIPSLRKRLSFQMHGMCELWISIKTTFSMPSKGDQYDWARSIFPYQTVLLSSYFYTYGEKIAKRKQIALGAQILESFGNVKGGQRGQVYVSGWTIPHSSLFIGMNADRAEVNAKSQNIQKTWGTRGTRS